MIRLSVYSPAPPFAPRLQLHNSASAVPQNQLHLAECTLQKKLLKICTVGCDVARGLGIKKFAKN